MRSLLAAVLAAAGLSTPGLSVHAADHFLTIGGGGTPSNNQVSLEKNVLYWQRVLGEAKLGEGTHAIYFADGESPERDLQFDDPNVEPPKVNELLARLNRTSDDLYSQYRTNRIPGVKGPSTRGAMQVYFTETAAKLKEGDRLFIYFTGHGGKGNPERNTTLELWGDPGMPVKEFVALLDKVPASVPVVMVMVQCHAGGFADVIFEKGEAGKNLSPANRCGFFATVPQRPAAGCTSDIDEQDYKEYSTYFFTAISGKDRAGKTIEPPDFNQDGKTGFDEAHAYVMLQSDTIDVPVATSDVFLRQFSKVQMEGERLFNADAPFSELLKRATPSQRAVLEGLSNQLRVFGPARTNEVRRLAERLDRDRKAIEQTKGRLSRDYNRLRTELRNRVRGSWPELSNLLHPKAQDILKNEGDQIVKLIESHPGYKRWEQLTQQINQQSDRSFDLERKWVKCQRFLYVADSVALAANLERVADEAVRDRYRTLLAAEAGTLK